MVEDLFKQEIMKSYEIKMVLKHDEHSNVIYESN